MQVVANDHVAFSHRLCNAFNTAGERLSIARKLTPQPVAMQLQPGSFQLTNCPQFDWIQIAFCLRLGLLVAAPLKWVCGQQLVEKMRLIN